MLLWADSFDHYGTTPSGGREAMLNGAWAEFSAGNGTLPYVSNARARTGSHSLRIEFNSLANAGVVARRVLGATKVVVGVGFAVWFTGLPDVNGTHCIEFRDGSNAAVARCAIQSDGSIGVYDANSLTYIGASQPCLQTSSWSHVEIKLTSDDVAGAVEIRVNGETVLSLEDQDFGTGVAALVWGNPQKNSSGSFNWNIDDIFTWDTTGTLNNNFIGAQRVTTIFPDADTAVADWAKTGAANGYDCIDNVPPDGDTTYISTDGLNDQSEFELPALPPETDSIAGVYVPVLARLESAGSGNVQVSMISGVDAAAGPDTPLTTTYNYWGSVFETDPATDVAWTKSGLETALLRIEKTV